MSLSQSHAFTTAARRRGRVFSLWAAIVLLVTVATSQAQVSAPARPVAGYRNSVSGGLSYGFINGRDADFWGWSVGYSRSLVGHWFAEANITWDRETEKFNDAPENKVSTFTAVGTITYALTDWLSLTTGLGKGFADTDNPDKKMKFTNGNLGTGISVGFATPGLPQFVQDSIGFSIAYEYNITQRETSVSFDVTFGWSF